MTVHVASLEPLEHPDAVGERVLLDLGGLRRESWEARAIPERCSGGPDARSKARLVITAVVVEGRGVREVAQDYGVSPGWVSRLVARYRDEGDAALEPRSRRSNESPRPCSWVH